MTPIELAASYADDLESDADMVFSAAQDALRALRAGDPERAIARLREAERAMGLLPMRYADTLRVAGEATLACLREAGGRP